MEGIVPALMRALCQEAHCESGVVLWFDPQGQIANVYVRDLPSPQVTATWFSSPPGEGSPTRLPAVPPGPVRFRRVIEICADDEAVQGRVHDDGTGAGCPHRRLCANLVPSEAPVQRLCGAIVKGGVPAAALMLYRPGTRSTFSRQERSAVKAAARYLSLNGAAAPVDTSAAMYRDTGEEALLVCAPDGRVLRTSENGFTLLAQASGCPLNRRTVSEEVEQAGRRLLQRLLAGAGQASPDDVNGRPPTLTVINAWGLFRLRAFFEPLGPLGVLIERVDHLLVRLAEAMWRLDVSVQQGEALLLLAQGLHHEQIALRMGVTPNTVDYHIRQLYSRLGVHTRDEALAALLDVRQTRLAA